VKVGSNSKGKRQYFSKNSEVGDEDLQLRIMSVACKKVCQLLQAVILYPPKMNQSCTPEQD
jgi:hypothetical protein